MMPARLIPMCAALALTELSATPLARARGDDPDACSGFTLLDYKTQSQIKNGQYRGWEGYEDHLPIPLSYQFDSGFLDHLSPQVQQAAREAVVRALQSWSDSTNGRVSFSLSPWEAVVNSDLTPFWQFEGPSLAQWEALGFPLDELPGWGANIDFFSKPVGWTLVSGGLQYTMSPGILGFAAIYREGDFIRTVDIYLNEAWGWSAAESQPATIGGDPPFVAVRYACDRAHGGAPPPADGVLLPPPSTPGDDGLGMTPEFDVQTVVLHELGHALGLDHPNEAQAHGGALLDPYTFAYLPGDCWQSDSVMHGDYNGIKRDLMPADIGGMAFLYLPALPGDLDPNDVLDDTDAFRAIQLIGGNAVPTPYEVNIMDFAQRNGQIDDLETAALVEWVFNGGGQPAPAPPATWEAHPFLATPSALVVIPSIDPPVMTLGDTVRLGFELRNPLHRPVRMWTIDVDYDTSILQNPRLIDGSLFSGAVWVTPQSAPGHMTISRIALFDPETDAQGTLAQIEFDVVGIPKPDGDGDDDEDDRAKALEVPAARVLVTTPVLHLYAQSPGAETLIVNPVTIMLADLDVSGDGVVESEDWYDFVSAPFDFNQDGTLNDADVSEFVALMRQGEAADIADALVAPPIPE